VSLTVGRREHSPNIYRNAFLLRPFESLASYQLPATSYQLPATSYQLPATSYQLPATSRVPCHGASVSPSPTVTLPARRRAISSWVLDGGGREDDSLMSPCDHDRDVQLVSLAYLHLWCECQGTSLATVRAKSEDHLS
jgi:hypothetical protein